jgi:hypothetical protein
MYRNNLFIIIRLKKIFISRRYPFTDLGDIVFIACVSQTICENSEKNQLITVIKRTKKFLNIYLHKFEIWKAYFVHNICNIESI